MRQIVLLTTLLFIIALGCRPSDDSRVPTSPRERSEDNRRTEGLMESPPRRGEDLLVLHQKRGCPYEWCCYNSEWVCKRKMPIYVQPREDAPVIATLTRGEKVRATNEGLLQVLEPGSIEVVRAFGSVPGYTVGELVDITVPSRTSRGVTYNLYILRRKNGEYRQEMLDSMREDKTACLRDPKCLAWIKKRPKYQWWVMLRLPTRENRVGWTKDPEQFWGSRCDPVPAQTPTP